MLSDFVPCDERVPLLIRHQFIQVSHKIEENPTFLLLLLEMMKIEHYVVFRVQEIYHLTYHILEEHNFMIKILHSLFLLFIEVIHLISSKNRCQVGMRWGGRCNVYVIIPFSSKSSNLNQYSILAILVLSSSHRTKSYKI